MILDFKLYGQILLSVKNSIFIYSKVSKVFKELNTGKICPPIKKFLKNDFV